MRMSQVQFYMYNIYVFINLGTFCKKQADLFVCINGYLFILLYTFINNIKIFPLHIIDTWKVSQVLYNILTLN